jgi:hypothetical protein
MLSRRSAWLTLALLALVLAPLDAGCGGDEPADGDALSVAEASDGLTELLCARAFECHGSYDLGGEFEDVFGADPDACVARMHELALGPSTAELEASVAAGRTRYDASAAQACLETIEELACSDYWQTGATGPDCQRTFEGAVAEGGACDFSDECALPASICTEAGSCQAS